MRSGGISIAVIGSRLYSSNTMSMRFSTRPSMRSLLAPSVTVSSMFTGQVHVHPDGTIYLGAAQGVVMLRDPLQ